MAKTCLRPIVPATTTLQRIVPTYRLAFGPPAFSFPAQRKAVQFVAKFVIGRPLERSALARTQVRELGTTEVWR